MNFTEAVTQVTTITKRPDKVTEIQQAVNAAVSFFTLKGSFRQDLVESTLSISPTVYGATVAITALTRFRRFKYIKIPSVRGYLKQIEPEQIFTPGNSMQKNCYYTAGTNLTYILSQLSASLEIAYYTYAATLSGVQTHWLLDMHGTCVVDWAAAKIFREIGDDTSAATHDGYAREAFKVILADQALGA